MARKKPTSAPVSGGLSDLLHAVSFAQLNRSTVTFLVQPKDLAIAQNVIADSCCKSNITGYQLEIVPDPSALDARAERIRQAKDKYREANLSKQREYYRKNRDRIRAYQKEYRQAHREQTRNYIRNYMARQRLKEGMKPTTAK